jgi:hypothetical protein
VFLGTFCDIYGDDKRYLAGHALPFAHGSRIVGVDSWEGDPAERRRMRRRRTKADLLLDSVFSAGDPDKEALAIEGLANNAPSHKFPDEETLELTGSGGTRRPARREGDAPPETLP